MGAAVGGGPQLAESLEGTGPDDFCEGGGSVSSQRPYQSSERSRPWTSSRCLSKSPPDFLTVAKPHVEVVTLHVYSLGRLEWLKVANAALRSLGTGAFHVGLEVYGLEWSFEQLSGIGCSWPGAEVGHCYMESIVLGSTQLSYREVLETIQHLRESGWTGCDYNTLEHNCCHFADALSHRLGVGPIPSFVLSLAASATVLRTQLKSSCRPCCSKCPAIIQDDMSSFTPYEQHVVPMAKSIDSLGLGLEGDSLRPTTLFGRRFGHDR
mmetsp:Transcript_11349/g.40247  ORF Transcript_11349/g.40247 Transcript_11349/m.40247 type:complete len:266 (-) Transcript_11349:118-915(-)